MKYYELIALMKLIRERLNRAAYHTEIIGSLQTYLDKIDVKMEEIEALEEVVSERKERLIEEVEKLKQNKVVRLLKGLGYEVI